MKGVGEIKCGMKSPTASAAAQQAALTRVRIPDAVELGEQVWGHQGRVPLRARAARHFFALSVQREQPVQAEGVAARGRGTGGLGQASVGLMSGAGPRHACTRIPTPSNTHKGSEPPQ